MFFSHVTDTRVFTVKRSNEF